MQLEHLNPPNHLKMEDYKALIPLYLAEADSIISEIHVNLLNKDFSQLKKLAHKLKGASSSYGANKVHQAALDLEKSNHQSVQENFTRLKVEFDKVKLEVTEKLA